MPPMPMMGSLMAWWHSQTIRTAIGRMAGPLRPPMTFDSLGRRVSTSMAMARNVLTSETASAPASAAATANEATSVTFGVSFGNDGQRRHLADGAHHVVGARQTAAELDAAFLDVRARDVELECGHPFGVRQHACHLGVLVDGGAADVDDHRGPEAAQLRQPLGDETPDADSLQPDCVQHARRSLDDAWRRMAFALGGEEALDGDSAER